MRSKYAATEFRVQLHPSGRTSQALANPPKIRKNGNERPQDQSEVEHERLEGIENVIGEVQPNKFVVRRIGTMINAVVSMGRRNTKLEPT